MQRSPIINPEQVKWIALGLAAITSVAYILIRFNVLGIGKLVASGQPEGIIYISAGCYLIGGLLILLKRKWLWIIGAIINALVISAFFSMYKDQTSVILSAGGLATKIAQILLEATLIYLIFAYKRVTVTQK